jgi:hypothetical protein
VDECYAAKISGSGSCSALWPESLCPDRSSARSTRFTAFSARATAFSAVAREGREALRFKDLLAEDGEVTRLSRDVRAFTRVGVAIASARVAAARARLAAVPCISRDVLLVLRGVESFEVVEAVDVRGRRGAVVITGGLRELPTLLRGRGCGVWWSFGDWGRLLLFAKLLAVCF